MCRARYSQVFQHKPTFEDLTLLESQLSRPFDQLVCLVWLLRVLRVQYLDDRLLLPKVRRGPGSKELCQKVEIFEMLSGDFFGESNGQISGARVIDSG